ncbi:hypothetical protein ACWCQS_05945 [Streptomyces sp. NPDC002076]
MSRLDAQCAGETKTGIGVDEVRTEFEFLPVGEAAVAGIGPVAIGSYGRGVEPGDVPIALLLP